MRAAVLGHVEWVSFLRVDRSPAPGVIGLATEAWDEPAGGGGVAAVELARLAGACTLYTAIGDDPVGQGLAAAFAALHRAGRVTVVGPTRPEPHRRAITWLDPNHERTIVVIGEAQALRGADAVPIGPIDVAYVCKGDADAVRAVRSAARVVVATARMLPVLRQAGIALDALVRSGSDPGEAYRDGDLAPAPALVATTAGADGGAWSTADGRSGRWAIAPLPGPIADSSGCGDSFAAGLAFALAEGRDPDAAVRFAATRGALALTRRGAHG
ncbi:MAG: PfkB family carbohydrate kinase [Myxococcota bacterium]